MTVQALGGDFWKFHDLAFANQKDLTPENFQKWAVESGADGAKFKEAYDQKKYAAKVDKDLAFGRQVGARGTPAFRINGKTLSGAQPFEKFKEVIDAELAAADALAKTGVAKNKVSLELTKKNFQKPEEPKPQAPQAEDTTIWKVPVADNDPVRGAADALVTIVQFSDFQCPFCSRVEPTITQVMNDYKGDVRIVWKDKPLPFHPRAKPAATLARFAYEKGGDKLFWEAHNALFEGQKNLEDAGLEEIAKKVGLPWDKVKAAIAEDKYKDQFEASSSLGDDYGARGTPAFFINGRMLVGAQPIEQFRELINDELSRKGVPVPKPATGTN